MNVLVVNCGSSSIKAGVINSITGDRVVELTAERLGTPQCRATIDGETLDLPGYDHAGVLDRLLPRLGDAAPGAVGHPSCCNDIHGLVALHCIRFDHLLVRIQGADRNAFLHGFAVRGFHWWQPVVEACIVGDADLRLARFLMDLIEARAAFSPLLDIEEILDVVGAKSLEVAHSPCPVHA